MNYSSIFIVFALFCACGAGVSDYSEEIVNGYFFSDEGKEHKAIIGNGLIIPCQVVKYSNDNDFILAVQKRAKHCVFVSYNSNLTQAPVQYWIIDVKNNQLMGPLDKMALFQESREKDINIELLLELDITR